MALATYKRKRKFKDTPEPKGKGMKTSRGRFVVQEHHATRLHYDFRLELPEFIKGGEIVLKSWAVPKGIPRSAGAKHLAVQTEDHPVDYINFKGSIPKGHYGAGKVKIWDKGKFELLERKSNAYKVALKGKKLKGTYVLFRFKPKAGDSKKNWLIFKMKG